MPRAAFAIGDSEVAAGCRETVDLPLPRLYTHTPLFLPVHVVHGRRHGPCMFVSGVIHGDELNGLEIIRRLLGRPAVARLRGTLIAIPIVNVYGVIHHSRYLPDRRDLNRSFPGSERGSLTARVAELFIGEIVERCSHGIDLHTGAFHRANLPQIRANLDDPTTLELARAFGVPVLLNSDTRDGSLREAAAERGIPMLLYEGGQALRFDEYAIRPAVRGILNVMRALGMIGAVRAGARRQEPVIATASSWLRAPQSGIFRSDIKLGAYLRPGQRLGEVSDPFGEDRTPVEAPFGGIVIGRTRLPLVHQGEALFHVARFDDVHAAAKGVEAMRNSIELAGEGDLDAEIEG